MKGFWITITLMGVLFLWAASGAAHALGNEELSEVGPDALKRVESNKAKQAAGPEAATSPADSLNMEYVGHTGGEIRSVILQGNHAYVGEGYSLTVLDISTPGYVNFVGRSSLFSSWIGGIAVSGNYAFIANGESGLRVMDISNPAEPVEVSLLKTQTQAAGIALAGNYAYIVDFTDVALGGGLRVLDVSVPSNPVEAGFLATEFTHGVALSGDYAYVVRGMGYSMLVVDISDPTNPVEVGSYDPSAMSTDVVVVGNYAYLATFGSGMRVLDISNPTNPTEIGSFPSTGSATDIAVQGSYAYLAEVNYPMGLRIVDISDPASPIEAGFYASPGFAYGVTVAADFAYVGASTSGLRVVNVSDPANPVETDHYSAPSDAESVKVAGNYAYIADGQSGLQVVDVSDPNIPIVVGAVSSVGYIKNIAIQESYAYLADQGNAEDSGLRIVDISDPTNPVEVGFFDTIGQTVGVAVLGDFAFIISEGLKVVDVSNPVNPTEVGSLQIWATDVAVAGNYAYLAMGALGGIRVVDISDPTEPVEVGNLGTGYFDAPLIAEQYAYVPNGEGGLTIVDVTNPISPTILGVYDTPGSSTTVAVDRSHAYVADSQSGFRMIDISDLTDPFEIGYFDTPQDASDVSFATGLLYGTDRWSGLGLVILRPGGTPITTTTTILLDDPDPSVVGEPFTVTFGVTSSLGIPTGVVTVTVSDSTETCSGMLVDGAGSCQLTLEAAGTYTLKATYAGEGDFQASSDNEAHTVEEGVSQWSVHLPVLLNGQSVCSDFFDDFSDPASGWYTGEDDDGLVEYRDGEYHVLVKPADFYWLLGSPACDQVNYTVEADARWSGETGASYGLIFGLQGDFGQFYTFEVNSDYQEFALFRYSSGSWATIVPITASGAINAGNGANRLKATRKGNSITLEVNGTALGTWTDGAIPGASGTGLVVSSYSDAGNANARFDNFGMERLEGSVSNSIGTFRNNNSPQNDIDQALRTQFRYSHWESWRGKRR